MICNGCGRMIPDDATECNYCFEKVKKIDVDMYKKSFMPKRNAKELIMTFLLILVLIIIGIILYNNIKNFTKGEGLKERKTSDNKVAYNIGEI